MLSDNLFVPKHPNLTTPSPETKIWRYMSFAKYCSLLQSKQLYFASTDSFDDQWEGSHDLWSAAGIELISFFNKVKWNGMSLKDFSSEWNRWIRGWTYVNCWHMSDVDSEAMWKLYANDEGAVAIQSTYDRLRSVLPTDIGVGMVHYVDFWATPPSPQPFKGYPTPFVFKRKSLRHEQELRALVQRVPLRPDGTVDLWAEPQQFGLAISVSLQQLVEAVHVQPDTPDWLFTSVKDITKLYGLGIGVERSDDSALF